MTTAERYGESYYQRGIFTGESLYREYRWLPEATCKMAMSLIDHLPLRPEDTCLDYGAARGYLVCALRILNRFAWGCDISDWAVENSHPEVREYMAVGDGASIPWRQNFQWILCKDVLEHVDPEALPDLIAGWAEQCERCFVLVPLGDGKRFISGVEEMDTTHKIREPMEFWVNAIGAHYEIVRATHTFPGIKTPYAHIVGGHAFIIGAK